MITHRGLAPTRMLRLLILLAAAALAAGVFAGISHTKAVAGGTQHHITSPPSGPSLPTSPIGTTVLQSSPPPAWR